MGLVTRIAARQWAPSHWRVMWMQALPALPSCAAGATARFLGASGAWLVEVVIIRAAVPVTFIVITPTNHRLVAPDRDLGSPEDARAAGELG